MSKFLARTRTVYNEYPRAFWIYNAIVFIDRLGGFMLYPFFALYLTQKYNIGMSTVGLIFAVFSITGMVGSALGGAIADRMGRKAVIICSLLLSSFSALGMGFAPTVGIFIAVVSIVGTLSSIGGPAHEAVVADLLPPDKRAEGYGIIRVVFNTAVIIAPPIAGLLISNSYMTLFITDAIISTISAGIVLLALPETKPQLQEHAKPETMKETFIGYGRVFRDTRFLTFIGVLLMSSFVYMNLNSTLGFYLKNQHGLPELKYGWLLSINAIMVVVLQFGITRRIEKYKPMLMMALGALLYAIGFAMYGFIATFPLFVVAMVVITIGEMVISPVAQSLIAGFAPEDMRGRYMAVAGLSWSIAFMVGPYLAGLLLDGTHPSLLWVISGIVGTCATLGFLVLNKVQHASVQVIEPMEPAAAD